VSPLRLPQGLIPPARGHDPVKAAATGFSERQHILSTAKRLFAYFGYDGTSFDDIARAADIPAGQLLQLFEDKQKLLTAIFDELLSRSETMTRQPAWRSEAAAGAMARPSKAFGLATRR